MATGTLRDLLASGMSPEEINALLSQSNVSTTGYDPMGTTGRGEPYMPPPAGYGSPGMVEQAPVNMIRNNSTGRTFAPTDMYGQPSQPQPAGPALDYSSPIEIGGYGKGYRLKGDATRAVLADGRIVSMGRDTGAERARMKDDLAMGKTRADIAHTEAATRQTGIRPSTTPAGYRATATGDLEAIPGGPADLKAQEKDKLKLSGATDVDSAVATLRDAYTRLEEGGGITSTKNSSLSNAPASIASSEVGQTFGKLFGTANQSARNDIAMTRPALLAALMKATGMSAKQMDSNVELKLWLATATDPTLDVESNRRALDAIERKYLGGTDLKPAAATVPKQYSGAEIQAVALRTGKTEAQVRADMKAKGIL